MRVSYVYWMLDPVVFQQYKWILYNNIKFMKRKVKTALTIPGTLFIIII